MEMTKRPRRLRGCMTLRKMVRETRMDKASLMYPMFVMDGENKVEEIDFEDNTKMKIDGIFIAQGVAGSTDFAKKLGAKIDNDKIAIDENMETSIKGLFACGDCTGGLYQVSQAVYEGTKAGLAVLK